MNAFILSTQKQIVQIGDTIFYVNTHKTEHSRAHRKGIWNECEQCVYVPFKSIEGAQLALILAGRSPTKTGRFIIEKTGD